ncbi:hypothetical protein Pedsa_2073 [Pseudopedobacter saltans DSM 12145]|uniref:Uncharacterized protein n=1 Tax=Pseudopedobacter saltans (strain ATCC 51119 / DSM 12145 / JCM 21818 / CCUG 39354 / LMG 10337 / NBRC 100064 / NCIMB 13643) TaxID=762903 RepID=F0SAK5_PSESL|nr:hypothetical protein [Pseudopedobacter saltans]ADY52625.1 hypothetical protein Pedsa_2073 [Pseudopedobacter saltans DSM 12145]
MRKSMLDKLNEEKERELKEREKHPVKSEGSKESSHPSSVIDEMESFTDMPSEKLRRHRGPINSSNGPGV